MKEHTMGTTSCLAVHPDTGSACVVGAHDPDRNHWDGSITTWSDDDKPITSVDGSIDLALCAAPSTVKSDDGRMRAVVASAYLPAAGINRGVHLVVYNRGEDELIAPDDRHWAVAVLYNREDNLGISYLAHGDYDMTYAEATAVFVKRIERQG